MGNGVLLRDFAILRIFSKYVSCDLHDGSVVKTLSFHLKGCKLDPKIPHAAQHG